MSDSNTQHRPIILNFSSRTYLEHEPNGETSSHDPTSTKERNDRSSVEFTDDPPQEHKGKTLISSKEPNDRSMEFSSNSNTRVPPKGSQGRKFSALWKRSFPFLEHDQERNLMFCRTCRHFSGPTQQNMPFVAGTGNFRSSSILFHENSVLHLRCRRLEESDGELLDDDKIKLVQVIRTVYFMIKTRSPFSNFPQLCRAQKQLGLDVGLAYTSHQSIVPLFAKYIASDLEKDIARKLDRVKAFSLIMDNSLSRVSENHQLVYIKYFREDGLKTDFLGVIDSSGSPDCIFQNVSNLFDKFGFAHWRQNITYVFIDVWSNCPSWYEGFVEILRNESFNSLISDINFLSHKLKCCSKLFSCSILTQLFNSLMYDIFFYYKNLPEDIRSLVHINKELETIMLTYGNLPKKAFACFSFGAFEAVNRDWVSLVHILKRYTNSNPDAKTRSVGIKILKSIRKSEFLWTLGLVLDIFKCLADFSNEIEEPDFMPFSLQPELKETRHKMQEAVSGKGKYVHQFQNDMCSESSTFRNVSICLNASLVEVVTQAQHSGDSLVEQANQAFESLSWLKDSHIVDTRKWPRDDSLSHFGNSEFSNLYLKFSGTQENLPTVLSEWRTLKTNVGLCFPPDVLDAPRVAVENMIDVFRSELPIVTSLLERLLLLDFSSDELACGYREMNLIKSSERCRLSVSSLQSLMTIALHGPEVSGFDPVPVMEAWMEGCARRFHKRKGAS